MQTYTGKPQSALWIYLRRDPGVMREHHIPMQTLGARLTGAPGGSLGLDEGANLGVRAKGWGEPGCEDQMLHQLPEHPRICFPELMANRCKDKEKQSWADFLHGGCVFCDPF